METNQCSVSCQIHIKAFMAGLVFPATILPVMYGLLYVMATDLSTTASPLVPMCIPLLFGVTNIFHVWKGERCPIKNMNMRLWVTGMALGLLVAVLAIFVLHVSPLQGGMKYLPLILAPIVYGAIFRYIIKCLNNLLGI